MAQYDGSIRINTDISTKGAKMSLSTLANMIVKTADEIASLQSKMNALKDQKIPTDEYKRLDEYVKNIEGSIANLTESLKRLEEQGLQDSDVYRDISDAIKEMKGEIGKAKGEMQELVDTGKAFTLGQDSQEYKTLARQLLNEKRSLGKLVMNYAAAGAAELLDNVKNAYRKLGDTARKAFSKINRSAKQSNNTLSTMGMRVKSILSSFLVFNQIGKLFKAATSGIKEGFENLYKNVSSLQKVVDGLKASTLTLKNALAAAFRPLVEIAIPYIQKAIEYITQLVSAVGQFISAITGQKYYTRAIKQTTAAIKEQTKAQNRQVSSLDRLNNLTSQDNIGTGSGAGGGYFEEVPVSDKYKELADRVKDLFSQIFGPLKKAWNREGKFVMNSWKTALKEIGSLVRSIGSDFLDVWQQEKTIRIFYILLVISDLQLVILRGISAWHGKKTKQESGF